MSCRHYCGGSAPQRSPAGDRRITIWGTGTPRREFLHVDDCADALVFLLRHYSDASTINVGVGRDVTIAELASVVAGVVGFKGEIGFDTSRLDGTPRKLLDVSRLTTLRWQAHTGVEGGDRVHLPMARTRAYAAADAARVSRDRRATTMTISAACACGACRPGTRDADRPMPFPRFTAARWSASCI
jgi:hypothetical protein